LAIPFGLIDVEAGLRQALAALVAVSFVHHLEEPLPRRFPCLGKGQQQLVFLVTAVEECAGMARTLERRLADLDRGFHVALPNIWRPQTHSAKLRFPSAETFFHVLAGLRRG
jgi:hypothetical protein